MTVAEALERAGELEAVGGRLPLPARQRHSHRRPRRPVRPIVERKAILRRLIQAAGRIAAIGYEDGSDIQEWIERSRPNCSRSASTARRTGQPPQGSAPRRLRPPRRTHAHRGEISGIASGFTDLDLLTTGFQPSDLIVLAARPSVGKTSLALNIAEHAAVREGKTVGVFSLEMSKDQLVLRLISSVAAIDAERLRSGFLEEMDFARIAPAMQELSEAPCSSTTRLDQRHGAADQGPPPPGRARAGPGHRRLPAADAGQHQQPRRQPGAGVTEISRGLKALARELKVPVIALSQLVPPAGDARGDNEPRLSDLRESGAIEQDADLVLSCRARSSKPAGKPSADGRS